MLQGQTILLVEDDVHVCEVVRATVSKYGGELHVAGEGETGLAMVRDHTYAALILDIMLPDRDGIDICRTLRETGCTIPILMLTARVEEADRVLGLELGADDYITKPFSPRELIARINAVIRRCDRSSAFTPDEIRIGGLVLDEGRREVTGPDGCCHLTRKEFDLLSLLARHPGQVFERRQLLDRIWDYGSAVETRTVDEHVKRLRQKLETSGVSRDIIETVWGVGYRIRGEGA